MIVADTSPLIFLAKLRRLEFLKEVIIPKEVYKEILKGKEKEEVIAIKRFISIGKIRIKEVKVMKYLPKSLHAGERAAISLALQENSRLILLDERKARVIAKLHGLTPGGTLGVLREQQIRGKISKKEFRKLSIELVEKGYRIREELLTRLLKELE